MSGADDTGGVEPDIAGDELRSELSEILEDQPAHGVDVDTVVVNHHGALDPKADSTEHETLREAIEADLVVLAERDDVGQEEAWGSEFFRVT